MGNIVKKLKKGGKLILRVPNGSGVFSGPIQYGDFTHQTIFSQEVFYQLAKAYGFEKISLFNCLVDLPKYSIFKRCKRVFYSLFVKLYFFLASSETGISYKNRIYTQNMLVLLIK